MDIYDDDYADAVAEYRPTLRQRAYQRELGRHWNCRDDQHPGCEECEPERFGEKSDVAS